MSKVRDVFVLPADHKSATGGNIYNAALLKALKREGFPFTITDAAKIASKPSSSRYWIDSLYLPEVPAISEKLPYGAELLLIMHYFPSMVQCSQRLRKQHRLIEDRALNLASGYLVTSPLTRKELESRKATGFIIEVPPAPRVRPIRRIYRATYFDALMVANLVPPKGILEFLRVLHNALTGAPTFNITIAGRTDMDVGYARRCQKFVKESNVLNRKVKFVGYLSRNELLAAYKSIPFFISASRMETFGMALLDARAAGQYLLVMDCGFAGEHVRIPGAGKKFKTTSQLAREVAKLIDNAESRQSVLRCVPPYKENYTWAKAAKSFLKQLRDFEAWRNGKQFRL